MVTASDGVRSVTAPTLELAQAALQRCQTSNLNTDAAFDTWISGLTTLAEIKALCQVMAKGLVKVGPPVP